MKQIALKNSTRAAIVDDHWYHLLVQFEWLEQKSLKTSYAYRREKRADGRSIIVLMHREIMGLLSDDLRQVDHIDRCGLRNLESNLRIATRSQNQANKALSRHSTSGFKGVSPHRVSGKWQAHASVNGQQFYLGIFPTDVEAAVAYNEAATDLHGSFALVNDIPTDKQLNPERAEQIRRRVSFRLRKKLGISAMATTGLPAGATK